MKNRTTILTVLALVGVSFVVTGCPHHHRPHRPHIPHPHRLPHPLQSLDSMAQPERAASVVAMSPAAARPTGN